MLVLAPAKINLHLRVGKPRADGFHPLVSWMCTVALFDKLMIDRAPGRGVTLSCDMPDLPCDAGNLIVKAAAALADAWAKSEASAAVELPGLAIRLSKQIPLGAGLGGGSSDGATTLKALNHLWAIRWPKQKLADLAACLGSDLPFFFDGPSAICRGRGELVEPISPPQSHFALLLLPQIHLPTPAVYRRFDQMNLGTDLAAEQEPNWGQWTRLPARNLLGRLVNDLEPAAFAICPELAKLQVEAEELLGRPVRMSGSGSSLFSLFDMKSEAEDGVRLMTQLLHRNAIAVEIAPILTDDLNNLAG